MKLKERKVKHVMHFAQKYHKLRYLAQQVIQQYTSTMMHLPRWRRPLVGYPISLLLVGFGLGLGLVEARLNSSFAFPSIPLLFAIVLTAFFWGVGPALLATLLSLLVLDYLYIPPLGEVGSYAWDGLLQLLTFAAAGTIISILANQREVARLRAVKAEQESALRSRQLTATFDAMSDGVVVYNQKGQILQMNAAISSLFGFNTLPGNILEPAEQQILCQTIRSDEQGQTLPVKRQPLSRLLRGEVLTGAKAADVRLRTSAGRKIVLNMSGAPIQSETGTIERAVLIYRDVTERRQLEHRTSEALKALLAMAQVLVEFPEHPRQQEDGASGANIPQPVAQRLVELTASVVESTHVAMLMIEPEEDTMSLVASSGFTAQEEQQWREQIAASPSLAHHIGGELLVTHLQQDEILVLDGMSLPLHTQVLPYYVQTMLVAPICIHNRLIGILCVDDGNREHSYTTYEMTLIQTVARLMTLILAREQLQQERALAQANELASREANRRMEEFLGIKDQQALVSVQDQGPGLAAEEFERIWNRFYRVPGVEVESGSGIGLGVGLYLCRSIIEQHGGSVGVQSTPGQGSTFWFTLPLTEQTEP